MDVDAAAARCEAVFDAVESTVVTDRSFLETVVTGMLARGHVLLEDVPGTGKTLTARSIAGTLGLSFSRVQFTPDLLPTDITGTHIFNEATREFEFSEGPIFNNVVLADEINRAPPKTQSALLEAMAEGQVTVGGETRSLPDPFFVIATQNPIEHEGTFVLPEAQVDRFMVKTRLGYPSAEQEEELLHRRADRDDRSHSVDPVLDGDGVRELQSVPETVRVDDDVITYITEIARATRSDRRVAVGVSPRGTERLFEAARARAVVEGREYVTPDTVASVAESVLAHRIVLTADASVNDVRKSAVVDAVLDGTDVPTVE